MTGRTTSFSRFTSRDPAAGFRTRRRKVNKYLLILALVFCGSIQAETFTGRISTDWHNGGNWSGGQVPNLSGVNGANITNGRTADVTRDTGFHGDFDMSNATVNIRNGARLTFHSNSWWGRPGTYSRINIIDSTLSQAFGANAHFGMGNGGTAEMTLDNGVFINNDTIKNGNNNSRMIINMLNDSLIDGSMLYLRHENPSRSGIIRGTGTITLSQRARPANPGDTRAGHMRNNGRVEAIGGLLAITSFGPGGLLDDNDWPVRMDDGNYAGWYASEGGELSLAALDWNGSRANWGEPSADSTVNVINSLGFFNAVNPAGRLGGSLLAVDNGSVHPGLRNAVAVWEPRGATFSSADLEIAFDWPAADRLDVAESDLKLFQFIDGGWRNLGAAINRGRRIITARGLTSISQLAVAEDAASPPAPAPEFIRGDPDGNGTIQLTDGIFLLNFLFLGGDSPGCFDSADADDNGTIQMTDGIYLLNYLFLGGSPPPAPFDGCGPDPIDPADKLACESSGSCP